MTSHFTSEFFSGNRTKLRRLFSGTAPIVITANGLLQRGGDNTYVFAQDANFWYLTGVNEPDLILVMDKGSEYLITPLRSTSQQLFDGEIDNSVLSKVSGIHEIYDHKEGWDKLRSRLKKVKHVATVASPKAYIEVMGFYTNPARSSLEKTIKSHNPDIRLLDLSPHFSRLRMIKQPSELNAIKDAINITSQALKEATKGSKLKSYKYEYELEAELTAGMKKRKGVDHAFSPIIAGGIKSCVIHNISNDGRLNSGELVLIDCGAEVEHYAADISRTYAINAKPSKRQRAIYASVLDVQNYALSLLGPGTILKDYEQKVESYMGEKLRELGLIKIITSQEVRQYFPYLTSHFLGLNVHDTGIYDRPLEPGVVLTVEPGIHVPSESIGIRIEDDVLITDSGNKVLSGKLSRELE